ncbi:MAG: hypothetical protein HOL41_17670, partial [Rhodospirillaceae bacterium]|nr:hypothetical protein [Rhodospirillaceae bacterium]
MPASKPAIPAYLLTGTTRGPAGAKKNRLYLQHASALAADAAAKCLQNAGKTADEIDCLISVSTSGIATPSLDARLLTDWGTRRRSSFACVRPGMRRWCHGPSTSRGHGA